MGRPHSFKASKFAKKKPLYQGPLTLKKKTYTRRLMKSPQVQGTAKIQWLERIWKYVTKGILPVPFGYQSKAEIGFFNHA